MRGPAAVTLCVVVIALIVGACSQAFDPSGPCSADGSAPGAYPDLEAAIPTMFRGGPPKKLSSGRTCTKDGLSTLAGHGVEELRFAGGTWMTGTDSGLSLAVFTAAKGPTLDAAWVAEFYETTAKTGKNVQSVDATTYAVGGVTGQRIDVLNGESFQTILTWQRGGQVAAVLVADFIREIQTREAHDKVVAEAIAAFGG
jgi:hypothetical protein